MSARAVVIALLAAAGCGDNLPEPVPVDVVQVADVALRPAEQLILMDDSVGLPEVQYNLGTHAAELFDRLASATGHLPSLHIGLATSDMGATGSADPDVPAPTIGQVGSGGCAGMGKDGALLTSGAPIAGSYLTDTNYQGDLVTAVSTMLEVGGGGCGFEQHLRAMERALTKPDNAGFLRPDAALAILIVADEDDCSANNAARLLDANATDLGPLQSFRCTTGGIRCNEPVDAVGRKTGCVPIESETVRGIEPAISLIDSLASRDRTVVAGIVGDPAPVEVELAQPPGGGTPPIDWLSNVCGGPTLSAAANAGVRLSAFLDHFEARGSRSTICGQDLRASFLDAARAFKQLLGAACIDSSTLADASADDGVQLSCEAYVVHDGLREPVPMCPANGPCVDLAPDPVACPEGASYVRATLRDSPVADGRLQLYCERAR